VLAFALSWYPWVIALIRGRTTGPNPLGPLVAGIIVTAIVSGRSGLREFFSRLVRWRVALKWYLVTFAAPALICLIAVAITLSLGWSWKVSGWQIEKLRELPERFLLFFSSLGSVRNPAGAGLVSLSCKPNIRR
jgi:hypothetical protein